MGCERVEIPVNTTIFHPARFMAIGNFWILQPDPTPLIDPLPVMNLDDLGKLILDRVGAMSDKVITQFLLDSTGKPLLPTVKFFSMADNPK
eukprot:scaffold265280_cov16-Prasinocladus_malaysianus.AAC.1